MPDATAPEQGRLVHIVTLECRDAAHADGCLEALEAHGRPDAERFGCRSYEFGLVHGTVDKVCIVERWNQWQDLDALLAEKVAPRSPCTTSSSSGRSTRPLTPCGSHWVPDRRDPRELVAAGRRAGSSGLVASQAGAA